MNVALIVTVLAITSGWARAAPPPPIVGPADETIHEVIKSLEASAVERVVLDHFAIFGLDALADNDRCLGRKVEGARLAFTCGTASFTAPWPPKTSDEVAVLLTNAMRLVDPAREVQPDRVKTVARALARAVGDPFTAYLPPELVAAASSSALFSATPGIEIWPRDPTKVREVRRGTDAARAGLAAGDRIVSIDNASTARLTLPEIAGRLQGQNDSVVRLRLKRGDTVRDVTVTRTSLPESDIVSVRVDADVLYIRLPSFRQGSAQRIKQVLRDVRPRAVILDLRYNGGGYVPEGIALADLFLSSGPIGGVRTAPGRPTEDYVANHDDDDVTEPLVVLVDGGSASASELLLMALSERKRAVLLGTQTAGKGSVQRQIHLPDGGVLKVTTAYYVGPKGNRLDDNGVTPDRLLAPPASTTVLEGGDPKRDSWILSALDELQGSSARKARASSGGGGAGPDP
jgi:carboxyl-terminal processing protease